MNQIEKDGKNNSNQYQQKFIDDSPSHLLTLSKQMSGNDGVDRDRRTQIQNLTDKDQNSQNYTICNPGPKMI